MNVEVAATPTTAAWLRAKAAEQHRWRSQSLNLCAAETITSNLVRELLASDFGRRYATRTGAYSGARVSDEIEARCEEMACRLFGCAYANISPISGHVALLATIIALSEPGQRLLTTSPLAGGYPIRIAERIDLTLDYFPLDSSGLSIDVAAAREKIDEFRPNLVVFGASEFTFPAPLTELVPSCRSVGATVLYDAAHPLGLIAGGQFQQPFADGVDVLFASTNKTFFGPHRGIVLTRENEQIHRQVADLLDSPPFFQSSHHVNTAVALTAAMAEMEAFGREYAARVIANARALAQALAAEGVAVLGAEQGFTQSHQVLLDCGGYGSKAAILLQHRLEQAGILADLVVRFGSQQATRLGMRAAEMSAAGSLIADVVLERRDPELVRAEVEELTEAFRSLQFSFEDGRDAFQQAILDGKEV
jgi:glycine hydroxymethyltransferase